VAVIGVSDAEWGDAVTACCVLRPGAELDLEALRGEYRAFLQPGRVLLSGHSHQAWPDVARDAQSAYFDDAARFVDTKWGDAIFPKMERVGRAILRRMGFDEGDAITFGGSTHELVFRLLSCFRWSERPRIVTTTSEFHSLHRQLSRLAEEGADVVWVDARDRSTLAERLLAAITPGTAMVAFSGVLFEDAWIVRELPAIALRAVSVGALPLVDAYHAFDVASLAWGDARDALWVTSGGYKYAQFGEGLCWLRSPKGSTLRPAYTGWFADFDALEGPRSHDVGYGPGGARFAGSTFDASALYRAEAVLAVFERHGLDVATLRAISIRQTARLLDALSLRGVLGNGVTLASSTDPERRAGFVSLRTPRAQALVSALRARGVYTDARGELLRLGPAPYLADAELDAGVSALAEELAKPLT